MVGAAKANARLAGIALHTQPLDAEGTRAVLTADCRGIRSERARRPVYLLSGLLKCRGGGGFSKISRDHYGCSNARNPTTCCSSTRPKFHRSLLRPGIRFTTPGTLGDARYFAPASGCHSVQASTQSSTRQECPHPGQEAFDDAKAQQRERALPSARRPKISSVDDTGVSHAARPIVRILRLPACIAPAGSGRYDPVDEALAGCDELFAEEQNDEKGKRRNRDKRVFGAEAADHVFDETDRDNADERAVAMAETADNGHRYDEPHLVHGEHGGGEDADIVGIEGPGQARDGGGDHEGYDLDAEDIDAHAVGNVLSVAHCRQGPCRHHSAGRPALPGRFVAIVNVDQRQAEQIAEEADASFNVPDRKHEMIELQRGRSLPLRAASTCCAAG